VKRERENNQPKETGGYPKEAGELKELSVGKNPNKETPDSNQGTVPDTKKQGVPATAGT